MPNSNTFSIAPIKKLLDKYIDKDSNPDLVIVDPFANNCKIGTITNDLNPEFDTDYHLDALQFLQKVESEIADIVLYDPPYSIMQAAQCYKSYGKEKLEVNVANMRYWKLCKDECTRILKLNGLFLSFGWNTNGGGRNRGFELLEILIVAHGGSKNDTLCTVEKKIIDKPSQLKF